MNDYIGNLYFGHENVIKFDIGKKLENDAKMIHELYNIKVARNFSRNT